MEDFSLVQTVGCLTGGPDGTWVLTRSAPPVTSLEDVPGAEGVATAAAQPLGSGTYRLLGALPFEPAAHVG